MKQSEFSLPVAALALPGEQGNNVTPAAGDEVDITGTATVSRIEGDTAFLTPTTINGEKVAAAAPMKPESLDDEEEDMREDARKTDTQPRIY